MVRREGTGEDLWNAAREHAEYVLYHVVDLTRPARTRMRVFHRLLPDAVRLGHEGVEGEEDDDRQDQRLDDLVESAQRATAQSSAV